MELVTERQRGDIDVSEDKNGNKTRRSQRTVDITDAADYEAAIAALNTYGIDYGEQHPDDDGAVVTGISRTYNPVADMYTFTATYQEGGGGENFLSQPPTVRYEPYDYTEVVDKDLDDVPFTNSAGTPFEGGMEVEKCGVIITVRVPKGNYDFAALWPYANAVNSTALLLPDGSTVPEGAAKYKMPAMADRVTTAESCYIEHKFDCRPGVKPWRKNVIDQGEQAWAKDSNDKYVLGAITTGGAGAGEAGVVRLNGTGVPLQFDTFPKIVTPETHGKTLGIVPAPDGVGEVNVDAELGGPDMKVLTFRRNAVMDLNSLLG